MATIRERIANELAARVAALPDWTCERRDRLNDPNVATPKVAFVYIEDDTKTAANNKLYSADAIVAFAVRARPEDADPTEHDSNAYSYLDELVGEIEAIVHDPPFDFGIPGVGGPEIRGHEKLTAGESNLLIARLRVLVRYRHDYASPSTYLGQS